MRILHTSDWHLGQHFIGKSRLAEHQKFIQWLLEEVDEFQVDAVVIAGDVFDTGTPPSYARELYNRFVASLNKRNCRLLILAGNHDSVAMLNESRSLLSCLDTDLVTAASAELDSQVLHLPDRQGEPGLLVCAVPFIRPRDLLQSQADQSGEAKARALAEAIAEHYQRLFELAQKKRQTLGVDLPIMATGHLTTVGASSSDSVREIYIGTLEAFPVSSLPKADYIALGHIHRPQKVAGCEHIRYSGSPIPLSFDELNNEKQVLLVEFSPEQPPVITPLMVPVFQPMAVIRGNLKQIEAALEAYAEPVEGELPTWLSIEVETQDYLSDLQNRVAALCQGRHVEVLLLRRARGKRQQQISRQRKETLEELNPYEVFARRLELEDFSGADQQHLKQKVQQHFTWVLETIQTERGLHFQPPQDKEARAAEVTQSGGEQAVMFDTLPIEEPVPAEPERKKLEKLPVRRAPSESAEKTEQVDLFAGPEEGA
ncbi:exonuclease subunit SbcD [Neptuniibacter halophilus]|uniref:exonuclease subunit SbcD n=1 Tax=Neptuniibacter halophilus TaxID=651666 RepID=UPI002574745C|nr:exonuclease subunit SbcD [Neptuniibacter halophilus]